MRVAIKVQVDKDLDSIIVITWFKSVGNRIEKGENILHVESLKADVDIASPESGTIVEIVAHEGEEILRPQEKRTGSWDAVFGWIETHAPPPSEAREIKSAPREEPRALRTGTGIKASPLARKKASALGVDLGSVHGTGPDGRVTVGDVEHAVEPVSVSSDADMAPAAVEHADDTVEELGIVQQFIAQNMMVSWQCIPHAGAAVRINFRSILAAREAVRRTLAKMVGIEDARKYLNLDVVVIEGILCALRGESRTLNSCYGCEHFTDTIGKNKIKIFGSIHLGIAYNHHTGLLVPVLKSMENVAYRVIAERLDDLYTRMRENKVKPQEFRGGTFTFNNVGVLGGDTGQSIIIHGQSAISILNRIERDAASPWYGYGEFALRFDHRPHNGGNALRFLAAVKEFVERIDFYEHVLAGFQE